MNIHSLKLKFIIILIGILSAILLLQTFYFIPKLEVTEKKETLEIQQKIAQQLVATFELSFQQTIAEIEAIAKLPAIISLEKEKLDFTLSFRKLADFLVSNENQQGSFFHSSMEFKNFESSLKTRIKNQLTNELW